MQNNEAHLARKEIWAWIYVGAMQPVTDSFMVICVWCCIGMEGQRVESVLNQV